MKKFKTILASLFVIFATAFTSACSCGAEPTGVVVYENNIDIRCVTENVNPSKDEDSGVVTVHAHLGDTFGIEYDITPANVTYTEVNWSMSEKGYIEPLNRDWTRAKSTKEVVQFRAVARKGDDEPTEITITFKTRHERAAICNVIIYDKRENIPTYDVPSGIKFDANTNTLSWNPVEVVYNAQGGALTNDKYFKDLSYEISKKNLLTNDEPFVYRTNKTTYSGASYSLGNENYTDEILSGVPYEFKVRAVGNEDITFPSEFSNSFKFYKLNKVTEVKNNQGKISFLPSENSAKFDIYQFGFGSTRNPLTKSTAVGTNNPIVFDHTQFSEWQTKSEYNIQIQAFPAQYDVEKKYAEKDGVFYYPSDVTEEYTVKKLYDPTITIENVKGDYVLNGVTFTNVFDTTRIKFEANQANGTGQRFAYNLIDTITNLSVYQGERETLKGEREVSLKLSDIVSGISGLATGRSFKLEVRTIGDQSTISSDNISGKKVTIEFNTLSSFPTINEYMEGGVQKVETNADIENDILKVDSMFSNNGIQVFAVFQSSNANDVASNSKYFALEGGVGYSYPAARSYNFIDHIKGLSVGTYKIYATPLALVNADANNLMILPSTLTPIKEVEISAQVQSVEFSNTGILSFLPAIGDNSKGGRDYLVYISRQPKQEGAEMLVLDPVLVSGDNYNTSSQRVEVDMADILANLTLNPKPTYKDFFNSADVYIEIVACGGVKDSKVIINSTKTRPLHIEKLVFAENTSLSVVNNALAILPPENHPSDPLDQLYRIDLVVTDKDGNSHTYTSQSVRGSYDNSSKLMRFNLLIKEKGMGAPAFKDGESFNTDNSTSFFDLLDANALAINNDPNNQASNVFHITAIGTGGGPEESTIDSVNIYTSTQFAQTPTNVKFSEDGLLTWESSSVSVAVFASAKTEEAAQKIARRYNYEIKFYEYVNETTRTLLDTATMKVNPEFVFDEATSKVTSVSLQADVSSVIAENVGKVIAIEVTEHVDGLFTNASSTSAFATKLTTPTLSYATNSDKLGIGWDSITFATNYDLTINMLVDGVESLDENEDTKNIAGNFFSVTNRMDSKAWGVGTYTFSAIAKAGVNEGTTSATPYIITSDESKQIVVNIISDKLNFTVLDDKVTFNNIFADIKVSNLDDVAGYTIRHKADSTEITYVDLVEPSIKDKRTLTIPVDKFVAGENSLDFVTNLQYLPTGFILSKVADTQATSINKLQTPTNLRALGGDLVFDVKDEKITDAKEVVLKLFKGDSNEELKGFTYTCETLQDVDTKDYLEFRIDLNNIPDAGELKLKVRILSAGKIQSDISAETVGTKIATVQDLTLKSILEADGKTYKQWLVWTAAPKVTSYEIGYANFDGTTVAEETTLVLNVAEQSDGSYKAFVKVPVVDGEGEEEKEIATTFKFSNDGFYYAFDYETFIGSYTGDKVFSIRALTDNANTFSSSKSKYTTITKFDNKTNISVDENGVVVIADYVANGSQTPTNYRVNIYKVTSTGEGENISTEKVKLTTEPIVVSGTKGITIDLNTISACSDAGEYLVEIQYYTAITTSVDDLNNVISSEIIPSVNTFTKLAKTIITTQSGEIAWANVAGATDYTLEIREVNGSTAGSPVLFNIIQGEGSTVLAGNLIELAWEEKEEEEIPENPEGETPVAPTAATESYFQFKENQLYVLRVKSNGKQSNGADSNKLHSIWSDEFQVQKLARPDNVKIVSYDIKTPADEENEIPAEVTSRSPVIAWTPNNETNNVLPFELYYSTMVEDAENPYNPNIGSIAGGNLKVNSTDSPLYNYAIYRLRDDLPKGNCTISIRQLGNTNETNTAIGLLTSEFETIDVNYITETTRVNINNGIVEWAPITGAYSYRVDVYSKADYDAAKNSAIPEWTTYTATENLDLARVNIKDIDKYYGAYVFVVRVALIDVNAGGIVTTSTPDDFNDANTLNIYKPKAFEKFRVKDGNFSWRISLQDVKSYTNLVGLDADTVIKFVYNTLNKRIDETIQVNEDQIAHLLNVELIINNTKFIDKATSVQVMEDTITYDDELQEYVVSNEKSVNAGMYEDTSNKKYYLEYVYDMDMAPEYTPSVEIQPSQPETPEEGGEGEGIETSSLSAQEESSPSTDTKNFPARDYVVQVSPMGQVKAVEGSTNIINGGFSAPITAFKPNTPRTYTTNNADIYEGKVQWELSTTEKLIPVVDSEGNPVLTQNSEQQYELEYYRDYRIEAFIDGQSAAYKDVTVGAHGVDPNILQSGYQYWRNLKNDLFVVDDNTAKNLLKENVSYTLQIQTRGTADSSARDFSGTIYLNSNACIFREQANILGVHKEVAIQENHIEWLNELDGSSAVKVFIYGPFNNLSADEKSINDTWLDYMDINALSAQERVEQSIVEFPEADLGTPRVAFLEEVDGVKIPKYSITDQILNGEGFAPGGYVFRVQKIGNRNGIVDSPISINYYANKLAQVAPQTAGWIGCRNNQNVIQQTAYRWNGTEWTEIDYTGTTDIRLGSFIWDPVAGANAFKIQLFRQSEDSSIESVDNPFYTRETVYEVPSGDKYPVADVSGQPYRYLLRVIAVNLTTTTQDGISVDTLSPNYFTSDILDSTAHLRLDTPVNMTLNSAGTLKWNGGSIPVNKTTGSYRVRVNSGSTIETFRTESNQPVFELQQNLANAGTVNVDVKALPGIDTDTIGRFYISSNYCETRLVKQLPDPIVRLEDGVFTWWTGDTQTPTRLIVDGNESEVFTEENSGVIKFITSYNYFTDITEHKDYKINNELLLFPEGTHEFSAQFKGSITPEEGDVLLTPGTTYYIASQVKGLSAFKLPAPEIENVQIEYAGSAANMVAWNAIPNAEGYRVRVFAQGYLDQGKDYEELVISTTELITINSDHDYFGSSVEDGQVTKVYLKLSASIFTNFIGQNGAEFNIYVQAIGSGIDNVDGTANPAYPENGTLYLASSYSRPTTIGIPPTPTNFQFADTNKGIITWEVASTGVYNIKLVTNYNVNGVSQSDLTNYWIPTSDVWVSSINSNATKPYDEIVYREVNFETITNGDSPVYNLTVKDTIQLKADGSTPTSYKLTNIGSNYTFELTAIAFVGNDDNFKSRTYIIGNAYTFMPFGKGDGSENYEYTISDYTTLKNIEYYMDRNFVMTENVTFSSQGGSGQTTYQSWNTIKGTFSGSINGQLEDGSNAVLIDVGLGIQNIGNIYAMSMFEDVTGTISNIDIRFREQGVTISNTAYQGIQVATLALNNYGTIRNINVTGNINVRAGQTDQNWGTRVAGLVLNNESTGRIENVSYSGDIVALDTGLASSYAGGIVRINSGSIVRAHFSGLIRSNQVGGISAINYGSIDRSYVDNAELYVTDESSVGTANKDCVAGGISAHIDSNYSVASITNSYSKAKIYITKKSSSGTPSVGGLVAIITGQNTGSSEPMITITGCYVVTDIKAKDSESIAVGVTVSTTYFIKKYDSNLDPSVKTSDNYYCVIDEANTPGTHNTRTNGVEFVSDTNTLYGKLDVSVYDRSNGTLLP